MPCRRLYRRCRMSSRCRIGRNGRHEWRRRRRRRRGLEEDGHTRHPRNAVHGHRWHGRSARSRWGLMVQRCGYCAGQGRSGRRERLGWGPWCRRDRRRRRRESGIRSSPGAMGPASARLTAAAAGAAPATAQTEGTPTEPRGRPVVRMGAVPVATGLPPSRWCQVHRARHPAAAVAGRPLPCPDRTARGARSSSPIPPSPGPSAP